MLVQLLEQPQVGLLLAFAECRASAWGLWLLRAGAKPFMSLKAPPHPGCRDSHCETAEAGQGNLKRFIIENSKQFAATYSYTNIFLPL